ncbi:MAG TPA: translation initiation factor IF-2 subunit alpha [Candidatus Bathyarchaeia archaeon]|nr:translation initiation factor IF-2 subunit alpha [Candidatus Bathyarchaeia archaeon]
MSNKDNRLEDDLFDPDSDVETTIEGFPKRNELVVATVREVSSHGAYVSLDEFGERQAYVHISELSRTWVKNIKVHIREGQRIVAKVLRVDPYKGQVDLSIKRVPDQMKKLKLLESKRAQTAKTLFDMIVEKMPEEERVNADKVADILAQHYDMLYYGLEYASTCSQKALTDIGIDDAWAKVIRKIASENIIAATVEIKGTTEITIPGGDGVFHLQEALIAGRDNVEEKNTSIRIYTEGSPRYAIEVTSEDYKVAEKALDNALQRIEEIVDKYHGTYAYTRKK